MKQARPRCSRPDRRTGLQAIELRYEDGGRGTDERSADAVVDASTSLHVRLVLSTRDEVGRDEVDSVASGK